MTSKIKMQGQILVLWEGRFYHLGQKIIFLTFFVPKNWPSLDNFLVQKTLFGIFRSFFVIEDNQILLEVGPLEICHDLTGGVNLPPALPTPQNPLRKVT